MKGDDDMKNHSVRPADDEIENTVKQYSDMLFRLCFSMLCKRADAEDAVSDTFIRYITNSPGFNGEEHKKAWLIRVAANICKDMHRFNKRNAAVNIDEFTNFGVSDKESGILADVMRLPYKYKSVIHLFYIEGYKTAEISDILSVSPSAVRKRLEYGRKMLKMEYEGGIK